MSSPNRPAKLQRFHTTCRPWSALNGARSTFLSILPTATGFSLELHNPRSPLDADEREAARRLGEHMKEALHAYERVRPMAAQALAGHTLLQAFPYPMWLVDVQRFIASENQGASAETQSEARVARHGMRLPLTRARSDQKLTEELHVLYRKPQGSSSVVDLRTTATDPPTWLHLSLLVPGSAMGTFGDVPLVLATLFDSQHVSLLDPFALGNMFKLTPAEAKVAARLADGLTAEQIAQAQGVALPTVRTQIRQVITELGAERTADVVRLLREGEALWSTAGRPY